ncbi:MAG TPA: hypothetical protein VND64_19235 [Pirellulales bacterium]|nr:hypothetical protein [Pirellulales bacterium]
MASRGELQRTVDSMTTVVEGFYRDGNIELSEPPRGLQEGPVRVILIAEDQPKPPPLYLTFGKYPTGRMSTIEDFKEAEWRREEP